VSLAVLTATLSGVAIGSLAGAIAGADRRPALPLDASPGHRRGRRALARLGASAIGRRSRRDRLRRLIAITDPAWTIDELVGLRLLVTP
jgi:hypothetical protein